MDKQAMERMQRTMWSASAYITPNTVTQMTLPDIPNYPENGGTLQQVPCLIDFKFPRKNGVAIQRNGLPNNAANPIVLDEAGGAIRNPGNPANGASDQLQVRAPNGVESDTAHPLPRFENKIQNNDKRNRWYESVGATPLDYPPLLKPLASPISIGDIFYHKYMSKPDENGKIDSGYQLWFLLKDEHTEGKFQWKFVQDMKTTHHPILKDRVLRFNKHEQPSWVCSSTYIRWGGVQHQK